MLFSKPFSCLHVDFRECWHARKPRQMSNISDIELIKTDGSKEGKVGLLRVMFNMPRSRLTAISDPNSCRRHVMSLQKNGWQAGSGHV